MPIESPTEKPKLGPPIDIFEVALFGPGRYRLWLIPCGVIGLLIGLGMALIKPNVYSSSAQLYVTWGEREQWNAEKLIRGAGGGMGGSRRKGGGGFGLAQELRFITNHTFYERIAREVGSHRLFEKFDPLRYDTPNTPKYIQWQHLAQDWWLYGNRERSPEAKRPSLDLETQAGVNAARNMISSRLRMGGRGPNILQISYTAGTPELAQDVVQAAVKVYMQRHYEIFDERFNADFVTAMRDEAENENKLASEEFYKHQQDCGFHNITLQRAQLMRQKMEAEEQLERWELRLEEIQREKEYLQDQLAITPEKTTIVKEPWETRNPIFTSLETKLKQYSEQIAKLDLTFKPDSPLYVQQREFIEAQIARVEEQLDATPPLVERGRDYEYEGPNPEFKEVTRGLEKLEMEKEKILIGQNRKRTRLEATRETLDAIMACEPKHADMATVIRASRAKASQLDRALNKREEVKILDVDESMGNVWVVKQPSYNPAKIGPRRSQTGLQGLGIGLGVAVGLAILRQLLDQRLRYPFAVQRILGAPVLGVVPEQRNWKRLTRKMKKQEAAAART